jgi:hypothetical protein
MLDSNPTRIDFHERYQEIIENYNNGKEYTTMKELFDQLILSYGFVKSDKGYVFKQAIIYSKPYMINTAGRFKGYPFRTFDFDNYKGGYSDHFPTYIILLKEID